MTARLVLGDGEEIVYLDALKRVHLQTGDVLVVKSDRYVSLDVANRLHSVLKELFPDNRVLITEGVDLAVIRP